MLIIVSGPSQSRELTVLDNDDGSVSLDFPQELTVQLGYFNCSVLG